MTYLDLGRNVYGLNRTGQPAPQKGICIPAAEPLRELLALLELDDAALDEQFLRHAMALDVADYLAAERASPRGSAASLAIIEAALREEGFGVRR